MVMIIENGGTSIMNSLKQLKEKINIDLDLEKSNPMLSSGTTEIAILNQYKRDFDEIYSALTMTQEYQHIGNSKYKTVVNKPIGFVVLRDGHVCLLFNQETFALYPLFRKTIDNRIHALTTRLASPLPIEIVATGGNDYIEAIEYYNKHIRSCLHPIEQVSKQIIAVHFFQYGTTN